MLHTFRKGKVMKALSCTLLLMAGLAFVLVGCTDNSASVVSPGDQTLSGTADLPAAGLGKVGAEVHSVSGNLHKFIRFTNGATKKKWDCFSKITLNARLGQDGTVSGSISCQYVGTPPEGYFPPLSGRVIQLKVEESPGFGMMAKVMWETTKGAELFPPELGFGPAPIGCMVMVDRGEGKKDTPDCGATICAIDNEVVMTDMGFYPMSPSEFVDTTEPWAEFFGLPLYTPVDNGNLQVR